MPKKAKVGKNRLDKFYHLAKEQGYRARSAFKLIQLNKKYDFLSKSKTCLDLGAAPGGWLQVAQKFMPVNNMVVGVDLDPIRPLKNVTTIVGDFTTPKVQNQIKKAMQTWKCDVVLHDGAPNVGSAWSKDAYSQAELVLIALKVATVFLSPNGWFVTKVFRSADYHSLLWVLNQLFRKVESTKPPASRNESAEIFVVCEGFLNPKKIDPKLLDPKHVFKDDSAPKKQQDVFHEKPNARHRDGYEDGANILYKELPASRFVTEKDPVPLLTQYNAFTFALPADEKYKTHAETTEEVKICCQDLRVLGKSDFKRLLKWRLAMRQADKAEAQSSSSEEEAEGGEQEDKDSTDDDEKTDEALAELKKKLATKKKKEKRKANEAKAKARRRVELKMDHPDDEAHVAEDLALFALGGIKRASHLEKLKAGDMDDADGMDAADDDMAASASESSDEESIDDVDEAAARYNKQLDEELGEVYEEKMGKSGQKLKKRLKREKRLEMERQAAQADSILASQRAEALDEDKEIEIFSDTENPLLDDLGMKSAEEAARNKAAERWFDQPMFKGLGDDDDVDDSAEIAAMSANARRESAAKPVTSSAPAAGKGKAGKAGSGPADQTQDDDTRESKKRKEMSEQFEEVSAEDSSDFSYDSDDSTSKAEIMAMGHQLLKKKRRKEDMIDDMYHRYAFNDDDLPAWFAEDERKNYTKAVPVTKEEVQQMKAMFKEINARPIGRIAQAKARKQRRTLRRAEKMRMKANTIADDEDATEKAKSAAIQSLYKQAERAGKRAKPGSTYVVAGAGGKKSTTAKRKDGKKSQGKVKMVDKRLKSDKRAEKAIAKRKKGGKSQKKGKGHAPKFVKKG